MSLKSQLAKTLGKLSYWTLNRFTQGGTSFPGKLAATIDPEILSHLARDYDVAIVTGTNGKTLTTSLAVHALRMKYPEVLTNSSGSNMVQGIISTFLGAKNKTHSERRLAVLEVDEGSLKHVVKYLKPKVFVHTNLFEDQLDRYGSIEAVLDLLTTAAVEVPEAMVIANGDCPILQAKDTPNPHKYFGFQLLNSQDLASTETKEQTCPKCQHPLQYKARTYGELGDYYCQHCFFKRPPLEYAVTSVDQLNLSGSQFTINEFPLQIPVAGIYNIYNALAAFALAHYFGMEPQDIAVGFKKIKPVFGRQEQINIADHQVTMNLVKNPVGFNQIVDMLSLEKQESDLVAIFNTNYADGTDISWINEADFESLKEQPFQQVYTGGSQAQALQERFSQAGFAQENIHPVSDYDQIIELIKASPRRQIHILASYTATLEFRKLLIQQGYLSE